MNTVISSHNTRICNDLQEIIRVKIKLLKDKIPIGYHHKIQQICDNQCLNIQQLLCEPKEIVKVKNEQIKQQKDKHEENNLKQDSSKFSLKPINKHDNILKNITNTEKPINKHDNILKNITNTEKPINKHDNILKNITNTEKPINKHDNILKNITNTEKPNKGKGAGGASTNKNGKGFEKVTLLTEKTYVHHSYEEFNEITFHSKPSKKYLAIKNLRKFSERYMPKEKYNPNISAHGCKVPDECYIDISTDTIFIIEKKFQSCNGSVCEKIQTGQFKKQHYGKKYMGYKIVYIYCLSIWFKSHCITEIESLHENNIPVFWGDYDTMYKDEIIDYITSC